MGVLSSEQLNEAVASLGEGWADRDGVLRKEYSFADFATAMSFANRVAEAAEKADHHPDMLVGWGRVELAWVSHDVGGISERDVEMARTSDRLA
ncbi:MAG: 4a-hydroxytetrahydrobiopterin dehydratase [Gaiellales bacterium]|nr:4a-hydroxytetrahydrobiopterin dehydratase [Gaiellales bacterium]